MLSFLSGAIMMACAASGLFFFKFWRTSRDRLFLFFAVAFWTLATERWVLVIKPVTAETGFCVYVFRLVAFAIILAAIIDKNRNRRL